MKYALLKATIAGMSSLMADLPAGRHSMHADVCLSLQELELLIYLEGVTEASSDSSQPAAEQACSGSAVGPSTGSAGESASHACCHTHLT